MSRFCPSCNSCGCWHSLQHIFDDESTLYEYVKSNKKGSNAFDNFDISEVLTSVDSDQTVEDSTVTNTTSELPMFKMDDVDDMFGPSSNPNYTTSTNNCPSIMQEEHPQKKQRNHILNLSFKKLKAIKYYEDSLYRVVIISNTITILEQEIEEEMLQKQRPPYFKNCHQIYDDNKENQPSLSLTNDLNWESLNESNNCNDTFSLLQPSVDNIDDSYIQKVLSQMCSLPIPSLLTDIDDSEHMDDIDEPPPKRAKNCRVEHDLSRMG